MSQSTITAIVAFGQAVATASGLIVSEIDGVMHLAADGSERSDFSLDEGVFFLLHYDPAKVRIIRLRPTDGGDVQLIGPVSRIRSEEISFQHPADMHSLRYRPAGPLSAKWYGRSSNIYLDANGYHADLAPCLGDISYPVNFVQYLHRPAPVIGAGENFPTDIIIEYEAIE